LASLRETRGPLAKYFFFHAKTQRTATSQEARTSKIGNPSSIQYNPLAARMEIINRIPRMMSVAREMRTQGTRIGLVPTRGLLHEGHLSLASRAREMCDSVILSIDAEGALSGSNPIDLARDAELAFTRGVDLIFAPSADDLVPPDFSTFVVVDNLYNKLDGAGHSERLRRHVTIIGKLINITQPHFLFLGRKKAQRTIIIKRMLRDLSVDIEPVVCPTVREEDGLALSSANATLTTEERRAATVLRRSLERCRSLINGGERDASRLVAAIRSLIEAEPLARVDYVGITDTERLDPVTAIAANTPALVSVAVYIGGNRLTDNIVLNGEI